MSRTLRGWMEFRILGPFEVSRSGQQVELGGHKQRAVLAALLIDANRVVSLDRLIDSLWPQHPPARASATVQVFVSNLRRVLEPHRSPGAPAAMLITRAPGYLLTVPPDACDAQVFERLAEEGRTALAENDAEQAAELLERALGLWRDRALAGFAGERFAEAEAARLDELRLCCAEDHVEVALTLGRHGAVMADLEHMVSAHPLRERPRGQLMLALYRAGRQAQALRVYQQTRQVLSAELGLEPSAPLKALAQAILRQDLDLEWEPPRPDPVVIQPGTAESEGQDRAGRILVVDDSSINRRLLVSALAELGYQASTADNGRRALELLRGDGFDVVLLDLLMPVMDGFATLQAIKQDEALRHLPVIMVSAVHEQESLVRCIELGAADYLPKPFSAAVLRARLRASLAAKRLRDLELDYLDDVVDTGVATDAGPDQAPHLDRVAIGDDAVGRLARKLQQMTREVQAREMSLRREIAQLRVEIDEGRRAKAP